MRQLFARKPIADLLAESPNSLRRVLGAGDLIMLAIGAVIGAGIFSTIGTETRDPQRPIRRRGRSRSRGSPLRAGSWRSARSFL
jgi:hypothetical protein